MGKRIVFLFIIGIWLLPGMAAISYALTDNEKKGMQEHIKEMQQKRPAQYAIMVQRATGDIKDCLSCHKPEDFKKQK